MYLFCKRKFGSLLIAMFAIAVAPSCFADLCADMRLQVSQANLDFQNLTKDAPLPVLPKADICFTARLHDYSMTYRCSWRFTYRDKSAQTVFDDVNLTVHNCFNGNFETKEQDAVNHPDTFEQHVHTFRDDVISVSIKDKGALQETFVFMGITRANKEN